METNKDLEKEEQFKEHTAGLRKQFMEMPLGALFVVQGIIIEVAEARHKEMKG